MSESKRDTAGSVDVRPYENKLALPPAADIVVALPLAVEPAAPGHSRQRANAARLEHHAEVAAIEAEWDALADRTGGQLRSRPGWVHAWWRAFGRGQLDIAALRRDGEIVAVLPLSRHRSALASVTRWHTPVFDAVGDRASVSELLLMLLGPRPRRVSLAFADAGASAAVALRRLGERIGYRAIVRPLEHCSYIRTDGGWDAYLAERDGKMLSELRRRKRLLEAEGVLTFDVHTGEERLDELLNEGFAVDAGWWSGLAGSAVLSNPAMHRFYREIAAWAVARRSLRLGFLRLNGHAIAFDFSIEENGVHYLLRTGFDPNENRFSPGKLLRYQMIERAFNNGLRLYDFLGTKGPAKDDWTPLTRERSLIQLFSPSLAGLVDWATFAFGRPLAKRALAMIARSAQLASS